jgi:hypothetical protein
MSVKNGLPGWCKKNRMPPSGISVVGLGVVDLSGGADSTALLLSMIELLARANRRAFCRTTLHGIRGERLCRPAILRRFCGSSKFRSPLECLRCACRCKEQRHFARTAALELRYDFLERSRASIQAYVVATRTTGTIRRKRCCLHSCAAPYGRAWRHEAAKLKNRPSPVAVDANEIPVFFRSGTCRNRGRNDAENGGFETKSETAAPSAKAYNPNNWRHRANRALLRGGRRVPCASFGRSGAGIGPSRRCAGSCEAGALPDSLKSRICVERILALDGKLSDADISLAHRVRWRPKRNENGAGGRIFRVDSAKAVRSERTQAAGMNTV